MEHPSSIPTPYFHHLSEDLVITDSLPRRVSHPPLQEDDDELLHAIHDSMRTLIAEGRIRLAEDAAKRDAQVTLDAVIAQTLQEEEDFEIAQATAELNDILKQEQQLHEDHELAKKLTEQERQSQRDSEHAKHLADELAGHFISAFQPFGL